MKEKISIEFEQGEALIMTSEQVAPESPIPLRRYSLVLTTKSVYLIKNGLYGAAKDITKYPLSTLMVANGIPQVFYRKNFRQMNVLDLYFSTGQVTIIFNWRRQARKWVTAINDLMTNKDYSVKQESSSDKPVVARTCPRCGASVSGFLGTAVQCPYCDSYVTIDG